MTDKQNAKITKTLGDHVKTHNHGGKEYKAGDKIELTPEQVERLKKQFGDNYFKN